MKKILTVLIAIFLIAGQQVTAQKADTLLMSRTIKILKEKVKKTQPNEYGIRRINWGPWNDKDTIHYWLCLEKNKFSFYKMSGSKLTVVSSDLHRKFSIRDPKNENDAKEILKELLALEITAWQAAFKQENVKS